MQVHASCAARRGADGYEAVLVQGPPGTGKSELLLRLMDRGFLLVADDQVRIDQGIASAPEALAGLLEVRGLGIFRLPYLASARLRLVIRLGLGAARLPEPMLHPELGLPVLLLDPTSPSAPARVCLALDAVCGHVQQLAGAFAP
jgi:HPr kinase/phosphorylase